MSRTIAEDNRRIRDLPVMTLPDSEWAREYTREVALPYAEPNPDGSPFELKLAQAYALWTYEHVGGLICPIPVGGGKTLISLSSAQVAFTKRGHQRGILLIPAALTEPTFTTRIPWVKKRMPINYAIHRVAGKNKTQRKLISESGQPGLYIMTYHQCSSADAVEVLRAIRPTFVVADEAHNLADVSSARSKRVWGVLGEVAAMKERVEFAFLTGTLTRKKIADYYRLITAALGDKSPVPLLVNNVELWDQQVSIEAGQGIDPLMRWLLQWARTCYPETEFTEDVVGIRKAHQFRKASAPGVVTSKSASSDKPIHILNEQVPTPQDDPNYIELDRLVMQCAALHENPLGEKLPTPMNVWNCLAELSNGFYNYQFWPTAEEVATERNCSVNEAQDLLARSKEYHARLQVWNSMIFEYIKTSDLGSDTDLQVRSKISNGDVAGIPHDLIDCYHWMHQAEFDGRVKRKSAYHWVCDWKMRWCVNKALEWGGRGTLFWAYHRAVQHRVFELAQAAGMAPLLVSPAFPNNQAVLEARESKDMNFVLSTKRCSDGLDLQHFQKMIYAQTPRQGDKIEQTLGRCHRIGFNFQDGLFASMPMGMQFDHDSLGAALIEATYIHQVETPQKAVIAAWHPPPQLPPYELLRERVPDLKNVAPEIQKEYLRLFAGKV